MTKLVDLATYIRSKIDGPFVLTFDIGFEGKEEYRAVVESESITVATIAEMYGIPEDDILAVYNIDQINTIKISMKRNIPAADPRDTDILGAQQYKRLLDLDVPGA